MQPPKQPEERAEVARFLTTQQERFRRIASVALGAELSSSAPLAAMAGWARGTGAELWLGIGVLLLTLAEVQR